MKTKIFCCMLFLFILCTGVYIRTNEVSNVMILNTAAFFYARARDLQTSNQYPLEDKLNYAPETFREDYPPFPAYFCVGLYKITNKFLDVSLYDFIMLFPVLMYIILSITGYLITGNLYGKIAGFFFTALLTIMPLAGVLTKKGYYTEESIGFFLILLFFFFFIKSEKKRMYAYLAIVSLTLLSLTWQIFIWALVGVVAYLLAHRKKAINCLLILTLPLLFGHIISVNLIGLDYSPIYMFKEAYIGYKYESTEDFQIAFDRWRHKPIDFQRYVKDYSYFGMVFLALGLFVCIKNLKKPEYSILLIYSAIGFIAISKYIKFGFFSLAFILMLSSIGMSYAYNFDLFTRWHVEKYIKKHWKVLLTILLIVISVLTVQYVRNPKCQMELVLPEGDIKTGETYDITLQVRNAGKSALCSNGAFSGVHIEVENATITEKKAYSSATSANTAELNYTTNDIHWFEATFDCLKHDEPGRVTFSITSHETPVKVNYRCWIPQFCLRPAPSNITPEYRASWRNEKCLHREPSRGALCGVPVYARYAEKQDYYCKSITLN